MDKKGLIGVKGFALLTLFFILLITLNVTVEPFKENLDNARDGDSLNCPGAPNFNQTAYNQQTTDEQLQKRPVCFVTGISMVWFIIAFFSASVIWLYKNFGGK